jgi:outer membrane lipopolysaccharide assembly protein LptE/RlpB
VSKVLKAIALIALAYAGGSGCGYSLSGRGSFLPSYIKVISVPPFANNTPIIDIDRRLTEAVRGELIGRGRYKIESDRSKPSDAVLTGEILNVSSVPAAFDEQQRATQYNIVVVAKIEFRDMKTDKVLWAHPALPITERYDVTTTTGTDPGNVGTFLGQNANAMQRLSSEFGRAVVSAILEAF